MSQAQFIRRAGAGSTTEAGLANFMRQIFNYMTGGVALSAVVAWFTLNTPALLSIATQGATQWIFFAIWMGFAFFMHKIIFSMSAQAALGVFIAFSALTGFALAPITLVYTGASVVTAFIVAAATFAGAAAYGFFNKKSMAPMGRIMSMIGMGLFAAIIVNIFVGSSGFSMILSYAIIPFVTIATAFEVNQLKEIYQQNGGDEGESSQMAIFGAATLYMNFVVLFLHLLRILGVARGED